MFSLYKDRARVKGDFFEIIWDLTQGGEISRISLFDGETWFQVNEGRVPDLRIDNHQVMGRADIELHSSDPLCFSITSQTGDVVVRQRYTIYPQGVLFCDMELFSEGISDLSIGITLRDDLPWFRWRYFKRPNTLQDMCRDATDVVHCWGSENFGGQVWYPPEYLDKDHHRSVSGPPDPFVGADFGFSEERYYTNHLEFFVEEWKMGDKCGNEFNGSSYKWHLLRNFEFKGKYTNRWGMALGAFRQRGNLIGQRIYHWVGGSNGRNYPPNEVIDAAGEYGCSVFILHSYWGNKITGEPYDSQRLREVIDLCHSYGMRVMLYSRPYYNGIKSGWFEKYLKRNWDGIYIDWGGPLWILHDDLRFPALDYFKLTQLLRETVGPEGLLISHDGKPTTYLGNALFDAYLSGEQQHDIVASLERSIYESGQSYAVPHIWVELHEDYATQEAAAYYGVLGMYPHIVLDSDSCPVHPSKRPFILPLWQIWRSMPLNRAAVYTPNTRKAADISDEKLLSSVYAVDGWGILAVIANMDRKNPRDGILTLDTRLLGMEGEYHVFELKGEDYMDFSAQKYIQTSDGTIPINSVPPSRIVGYALLKSPYPQGFIDYIDRLNNRVWFEADEAPADESYSLEKLYIKVDPDPLTATDFYIRFDLRGQDNMEFGTIGYLSRSGLKGELPLRDDWFSSHSETIWVDLSPYLSQGHNRVNITVYGGPARISVAQRPDDDGIIHRHRPLTKKGPSEFNTYFSVFS